MCRVDHHRPMPAMAVLFAVFLTEPLFLPAQLRNREATDVPPPTPTAAQQPPAQAFDPTPEQVGDALLAHQRYQEAIAQYKKAPKDSPAVWNKMGIAYQLMFDTKDAMRCYKESLRLDPRNARVVNNLGTVYDSLKDYRKAEHFYKRSLKLDPTSALVAKNLGTNLLARRKYKQGWEEYKLALGLDPQIFDERGGSMVEDAASIQERGAMNYYMAKGCVRAGLADKAIGYLRLALSEGFTSPRKIAEDSSFAGLRDIPAFQQLMTEQRSQ
ncbi:MAG: tetratricopeptide repeat protein [Terracidiphilus sp.]